MATMVLTNMINDHKIFKEIDWAYYGMGLDAIELRKAFT
jgi:hypothetical protein